MGEAKYRPTTDEEHMRDSLLTALEKCSLGQILGADKIFITEDGLVMGEFDEDELTELTSRLETIAEVAGTFIRAKVGNKPLSEILNKIHALPVGYTTSRILRKKQKAST